MEYFEGLTSGEKILLVAAILNILFLLFDALYNVFGVLLPVFGIHFGV